MEKGRFEFAISFLEPGRNSEQNGNVQLFFIIHSNCVFSKTIWRNKSRSSMEKGRIEFSMSSWNSEQNYNVQIFLYKTQIAYFPRQFHYGAKPVSQPAYSLAI